MLLKEDGHLDIEKVEQLSEEEFHKEIQDWDEDQWYEWTHKDGSMSVEEFFNEVRKMIDKIYGREESHSSGLDGTPCHNTATLEETVLTEEENSTQDFQDSNVNPGRYKVEISRSALEPFKEEFLRYLIEGEGDDNEYNLNNGGEEDDGDDEY